MYSNSPFLRRKGNHRESIQNQFLRDRIKDSITTPLKDIKSKKQSPISKEEIQKIISPEDFDLLCNFLDKPGLEPYLPQFINDHPDIANLISEIKKLNATIEKAREEFNAHREEARLEEKAHSLIQDANSNSLPYKQSLFDEFSSAWDAGVTERDNFDKAMALLGMYLGSNNPLTLFVRENFHTPTCGRQHFAAVKQLKENYDIPKTKSVTHLLGALGDIKIKNQQGHLQAIIAVIAHKLNKEAQDQIQQQPQNSRRSRSYSSFR